MHREKYVPPAMRQSGYAFVAAGALQRNFGGYVAYIKYKGGPNKVSLKEQSSYHAWYICPDREVVIVRNNLSPDAFYPYGDNFDECVDLSIYNDYASKGFGLEYIMTNFTHSPNSINRRTDLRTHPNNRIQVMSDSGGLQLVSRKDKSLVINPKELVEFYNNNVDAGMVLDLPLAIADEKTTLRAAKVQRDNNRIMLKHAKGIELINIFHGHTDYERAKYREIVEDDRIPRLALGGVQFNSMMTAISIIYSAIEEGLHYKQYHILGVFLAPYLPLLVKMANSGENPPHITSDSTSHIQSAANRAYHFQFDITTTSKRLPIGTRSSIPNPSRILPCQCPVCKALKYTDILGFGPGRHTTELLAVHNAYEMARYTRQLQEACEQLTPKEYNAFVSEQMRDKKGLKEFKQCLDFIEVASVKGTKAARKKHLGHLNLRKQTTTLVAPSKTLFGENSPDIKAQQQAHVLQLLSKMERQIKELS